MTDQIDTTAFTPSQLFELNMMLDAAPISPETKDLRANINHVCQSLLSSYTFSHADIQLLSRLVCDRITMCNAHPTLYHDMLTNLNNINDIIAPH